MPEAYYKILKRLTNGKVAYIAIGTWALKLAYPKVLKDYAVPDCDIVIDKDIQQIRKCIKILKKENWRVTVWEEEVDELLGEDFFSGKYYLRAKQKGFILDITYESTLFSFREMWEQKLLVKDYYLGSLNHILALKQLKGRAKDMETIKLFNN